ncbi:diguanylate cyclase [Erwinia billingiae]|uniref:diguanylate cyclase domain-containing protein n=1 Tax=Erwinia billingiae TaxID=182337 RepID=UPI001248B610|nr:diguanylate cyclase [Erwinia billingiae]QEW33935.1 diguanylate cyclase [Erwinia billingiae]
MHKANSTAKKPLLTLRKSLQRIHLVIIVVSLMFSGISLSVLSMFALRSYAENNLQLVATTLGYSVQPAVLAGDADAANDIVRQIGAKAEFGHARIVDAGNRLMVNWPPSGAQHQQGAGELVTHWIFPQPANVPIVHNGKVIGQVWLSGDASRVLHYLSQALKWLSGSLLVTALLASCLSNRMHAGILSGLQNIASVAHDVRRRRAFSLRVPSSSIAELNKLSGDFNSLLDELSDWQTHLQRENDSLAHQARHDALTGLPNRTAFEQALHTLMNNPQTADRVAVLFIDVDRFKEVNDTYGHAAGDNVLTETAHRLRGRLRKDDLVARLGGDEFAVLLSGIENGEQAARMAENVIEAMREPIRLTDGKTVAQSLSIGVALAKNHRTGEAMIAQADAAMYHIKELGGGWYFSPSFWGQDPQAAPKMRNRA